MGERKRDRERERVREKEREIEGEEYCVALLKPCSTGDANLPTVSTIPYEKMSSRVLERDRAIERERESES